MSPTCSIFDMNEQSYLVEHWFLSTDFGVKNVHFKLESDGIGLIISAITGGFEKGVGSFPRLGTYYIFFVSLNFILLHNLVKDIGIPVT